jgi:hypothetical protein
MSSDQCENENRQSSEENPESRRVWTSAGCAFCCRLEDSRRRSSIDTMQSDPEIMRKPADDQTKTNESADRCVAGEEAEDNERQESEFKDLYCVVEGVRAYNFGLSVGAGVRTRRGD